MMSVEGDARGFTGGTRSVLRLCRSKCSAADGGEVGSTQDSFYR